MQLPPPTQQQQRQQQQQLTVPFSSKSAFCTTSAVFGAGASGCQPQNNRSGLQPCRIAEAKQAISWRFGGGGGGEMTCRPPTKTVALVGSRVQPRLPMGSTTCTTKEMTCT